MRHCRSNPRARRTRLTTRPSAARNNGERIDDKRDGEAASRGASQRALMNQAAAVRMYMAWNWQLYAARNTR